MNGRLQNTSCERNAPGVWEDFTHWADIDCLIEGPIRVAHGELGRENMSPSRNLTAP